MFFSDTDSFVQDRIDKFHADADAHRRAQAARRPVPAHRQPQVVATLVRFAQVALTLGR